MKYAIFRAIGIGLTMIVISGCDYIDPYFYSRSMPGPTGSTLPMPANDDPAIQARAKAEWDPPDLPPQIDRSSYPLVGTVPPKPMLPTPQDIVAQRSELATEQILGTGSINTQASAPLPQTLPKPDAVNNPPQQPAAPLNPPAPSFGAAEALLPGDIGLNNTAPGQSEVPE